MKSRILVFGVTWSLTISATHAAGECTDLHGRTIAPGLHYVPGPDTCTLCVCESGHPKWCKAVLCSPPQDCKSFRLGNSCCEFICLDDTLHKNPHHTGNTVIDTGTDLGLRLIASAVTAILSLSLLFFLIHRLRQRKIRGRQNRQLSEDERSLGSIGYIAGSLAYLPGSMGYLGSGNQDHHLEFHYEEPPAHYPLWKPPGNYFPRGEAPPPYEEAVAAARAEAALAAVVTTSSNITNVASGTSSNIATTGSSTHIGSGAGHRTIPINLATSGNFRLEPPSATLGREPRSIDVELRTRNVEVTINPSPNSESRRSSRMMDIPAPLPVTSEEINAVSAIRSDAFYEDVLVGPPSSLSTVECYNPNVSTTVPGRTKTNTTVLSVTAINVSQETSLPAPTEDGAAAVVSGDTESSSRRRSSQLNDLNKGSLDSGTCSCSYQCLPPPLPPDDNDDYRSECENCKSTHGSRYYLEEEPGITSPQETMTLHRRPQDYDTEDQGYYRTSLTLPTHTRRSRTTTLHGTPGTSHSARENWFSSMPASSTSTSSEEE